MRLPWEQGGIEWIINELERRNGHHSCCLTDSALCSGFIQFNEHIFLNRGEEHFERESITQEVQDADNKLVRSLFHYLFSGKLQNGISETNAAFVVPVRVALKPYMALGHLITIPQLRSDVRYWLRNFHFFESVAAHCAQLIHNLSCDAYKEQLYDVIYRGLEIPAMKVLRRKKETYALEHVEGRINRRLDLLCRIWPYPRLQLQFTTGGEGLHIFGGKARIKPSVEDNPYFLEGITDAGHDSDTKFQFLIDTRGP